MCRTVCANFGFGARRRALALRRRSHVRGRGAVLAAKRAVEIGQVAEPGIEGDRADFLDSETRVGQQPVGAREPLPEHVVGEGGAFRFEQHAHVTRRHPVARRDLIHRQLGPVEVFRDVLLDGAQPRRPHAAAPGDLGGVARCADRERDEIVNMRHGMPLQIRVRERCRLLEDADIAAQQPQRRAVGRNPPTIRRVQAAHGG